MSVFKWRQFAGEVILWAVRWYCRYGISYRELEEMLGERGVAVDHTTLCRWVQRFAPELERRTAWYRSRLSSSWRVDETYVRVKAAGSTSTARSTRTARRSTSTSPIGATPRPLSASFPPP
jgi:transposase-like protein